MLLIILQDKMIDKKFLGNYSSLVWLEGTRQIKEPFSHVRKAPIY